jgi:hypothetical protein
LIVSRSCDVIKIEDRGPNIGAYVVGGFMNTGTRVFGFWMMCGSVLGMPSSVYADGLIEGMADGVNDCYDAVAKTVEDLGQRVDKQVRPSVEKFGEQVGHQLRQAVTGFLDGVAKAATKAKENLTPEKSES